MYPENPEGTQVIVDSMNMGYISDTARNRTHNLFHHNRESIPLGHSDGQTTFASSLLQTANISEKNWKYTCLGKPTHQPLITIEEWTYFNLLTYIYQHLRLAVLCNSVYNMLHNSTCANAALPAYCLPLLITDHYTLCKLITTWLFIAQIQI